MRALYLTASTLMLIGAFGTLAMRGDWLLAVAAVIILAANLRSFGR